MGLVAKMLSPPWVVVLALMGVYMFLLETDADLFVRTAVKPVGIVLSGYLAFRGGSRAGGDYAAGYGVWIGAGLLCSSIGDIMLELSQEYKVAFLVGLVAFLIGHVCYLFAYKARVGLSLPNIGFYIFGICMVAFLYPGLPSDLVVPVCIYTAVISSMGAAAVHRYTSSLGTDSSRLASLIGAFLFVISDSILAVNKFHTPFYGAKTAVMITYFSGQIFIAMSADSMRSPKRLE